MTNRYFHQAQHKPIIAVDFDETLMSGGWPDISKGVMNRYLVEKLKKWQKVYGARVILWTCREGEKQADAVAACAAEGLFFDAVNDNLPSINAVFGCNSRKIFANVYIDDKAHWFNAENKAGMIDVEAEMAFLWGEGDIG